MIPYAAVHVGRSGEVAGGMSQVVNGYLGWRFEQFDARFIASRDGSRGIRALIVAAKAALAVARLRGAGRTVVVVHLSEGGSFVREGALLALARARGFATVAHLHGASFAEFARRMPRLVGLVLRRADVVITLSEESTAIARRFVPGDAVVLLPNAVPSGEVQRKEQLVVFGGAVTRRKGVDVLTEAWRELGERHPGHGWKLVLAGPIVEPGVVPAPLASADFVGALEHSELMKLLDRSSIAVLPSRDEAMPMFILEAMARWNAVISTTVGGIPAVLGGGAGVLVEPGNTRQLRDALERAITDDDFRATAVEKSREAFETGFSAHAIFPQVERVWKSALDLRVHR